MKRLERLRRNHSHVLGAMLGASLVAVMLASSAPARPAADDVSVLVTLGRNGGRTLERTTDANFSIVVGVESVSGAHRGSPST